MGRKHLRSIVLRLDDEEREILKILEAALRVSEYTDDIDGYRLSYRREEKMISAMGELFTTIAGLSTILPEVAADVKERLQRSTSVAALEPVLARAFEIARRYKRVNPEKMRSEYGKLVMLLQDAVRVRGDLRMDLVTPIRTVGATLDAIDAAELLEDSALNTAVKPLPAGFTAAQQEAKERAFAGLVEKYGAAAGPTGAATVSRCLSSISDAIALIEGNRVLIRRLIGWLDELFKQPTRENDLSIRAGAGGAMLTHSHDQQYRYVKEALTLWDIVQRDIFDFWECVEDDMLVSHPQYSMRNTGQGINRVSRGPTTHARMSAAVAEAHNIMGGWVGIKVIHMGDDDVPNPLVFVDKYTIIPKLVGPIVRTIAEITELLGGPNSASLGASGDNAATVVAPEGFGPERYPGYKKLLLSGFESAHALRIAILRDFFRYGFDGSGDDGGACIDGRLTSAWNWCSNIAKKPYYQAFLLTGFVGFDTNFH